MIFNPCATRIFKTCSTWLVRGTDLFSLRLSYKKTTTANTIAVWYECPLLNHKYIGHIIDFILLVMPHSKVESDGLILFFKDFVYLFLERGERREKERERNISVWLPLMRPLLGIWPQTQACALTRNQTSDLWVYRLVLNTQTKPHQPGLVD